MISYLGNTGNSEEKGPDIEAQKYSVTRRELKKISLVFFKTFKKIL